MPLNTAEYYDTRGRYAKWIKISPMNQSRFGVGCCFMDGYVYAVGGSDGTNLRTVEKYDPDTNTWKLLAPMATARFVLLFDFILLSTFFLLFSCLFSFLSFPSFFSSFPFFPYVSPSFVCFYLIVYPFLPCILFVPFFFPLFSPLYFFIFTLSLSFFSSYLSSFFTLLLRSSFCFILLYSFLCSRLSSLSSCRVICTKT